MHSHAFEEIVDTSATTLSDDSLAEGRSLDAATCERILPSLTVSSTNWQDCFVSVFDSTWHLCLIAFAKIPQMIANCSAWLSTAAASLRVQDILCQSTCCQLGGAQNLDFENSRSFVVERAVRTFEQEVLFAQ